MSLKLLAPLTGIIGSIASVVGVSTSNSRPKDPSNPNPTHKWKIEVGTISIGLDCEGTLRTDVEFGSGGARLNLILHLAEGDSEPLLGNGALTTDAYVELLQADRTRKLWPALLENEYKFMKIEQNRSEEQLKVAIEGRGDVWEDSRMEIATGKVGQEFTCKADDLIGWGEGGFEIYRTETKEGDLFGWIPMVSKPLKFSISLAKCTVETDKKTAECDLKLTSGTDLDWSTKVSEKAKFTIS